MMFSLIYTLKRVQIENKCVQIENKCIQIENKGVQIENKCVQFENKGVQEERKKGGLVIFFMFHFLRRCIKIEKDSSLSLYY